MSTSETKTIKVELLGQQFTLKGEENPAHLERVASHVRKKLGLISTGSKSISPTKLALLTALNIASDYIKANDEIEQLKRDVESYSQELLQILEEEMKQT
jgi:cell division protein ZapA